MFNIFTKEGKIELKISLPGADCADNLPEYIKQHKTLMAGVFAETAFIRD